VCPVLAVSLDCPFNFLERLFPNIICKLTHASRIHTRVMFDS